MLRSALVGFDWPFEISFHEEQVLQVASGNASVIPVLALVPATPYTKSQYQCAALPNIWTTSGLVTKPQPQQASVCCPLPQVPPHQPCLSGHCRTSPRPPSERPAALLGRLSATSASEALRSFLATYFHACVGCPRWTCSLQATGTASRVPARALRSPWPRPPGAAKDLTNPGLAIGWAVSTITFSACPLPTSLLLTFFSQQTPPEALGGYLTR